jgi:hypothetical protein
MELLKSIITYGNSKIATSGLLERTFNLATFSNGAYVGYTSDGQATPLNNIDNYNGISYWILRSIAAIAEDDDLRGGGELYTNTFSFDLIVSKKKSELACDGFGAEFEIYQRILKTLIFDGSDFELRTATTSRQAKLTLKGYGEAPKEVPKSFEYATIAIKIEVILKSNITCIPDVCATI